VETVQHTSPEVIRLIDRELKRKKRRAALGRTVTAMVTNWIFALIDGWMLMLAVAVAHAAWIHNLPTIGYWWAVLLVLLLRGVFSLRPPAKKGGQS